MVAKDRLPTKERTVPRPGKLRIAVAVALLAVGAMSATAAFSASIGRQLPSAALGLWPPSGDVHARAATLEIAQAVAEAGTWAQAIPPNLPRRIADLSLRALALEPASVTAMRNLALYRASHGDREAARALMRAALAASRRDTGVNLWLTEDFARAGDEAASLELYDITIRTDAAAAAMLMGQMAQMFDQPKMLPSFENLLSKRPPWIDDFWSEVLSRPSNLENAYRLRRALHLRRVAMAKDHDALLIAKLADAGLVGEAFALHDLVAGGGSRDQILVNGSFDQADGHPPIGWKVVAESTFGSTIDPEAGMLEITALPEAEGVAAQQLVQLGRGGEFVLRAVYSGAGDEPLIVDFACVGERGAERLKKSIPVASGRDVRTVLGNDCRFAWFSLVLSRDDDPAGRDIRVSEVSLRRAD